MYKLPMSSVYCSVARVLASKQQYGDIRLLLQCIQKAAGQTRSYSMDTLCDEIIMAAIKVLSNQAKEVRGERGKEGGSEGEGMRERERERESSLHVSVTPYHRQNRQTN